MFSWRKLTPEDFPLLAGWLAQPRVARWWNHETEPEAVERDFIESYRGEEPNEDLLVFLDGEPLGLVQRARIADYPDEHAQFAAIVEVPERSVMLDYLIGEEARLGQGLGPRMIAAVVESTWREDPVAPAILVAVSVANRASWRALEKAGATRIGAGEMPPDNPIDNADHYVYRFDRPT